MQPEELALEIVRKLRGQGHEAYFAGGCVRDRLLGREATDYDVATSALTDEVLTLFPGAHAVGKQFGVALVARGKGDDRIKVEIATFRTESDYRDGRRPSEVTFTRSAEADAQRRDFTINGLFFDPIAGNVLDFVGGEKDIQAGLLRAIGNPAARFAEDKLRMLRAVRFAARLGFAVEPETMQAIAQHAPEIEQIAPERIRDELTRILTEGSPRRGFELLHESGLLQVLLPEVEAMRGVEQPPQFHPEGDVWTHTLIMLELLENPSPTLAWGTLFHDIGKPPTFRVAERIRFDGHVEKGLEIAERICRRLRFSNDDSEQALQLVKHHMRMGQVKKMREGTLKKLLRMPDFDKHLELHRVDCLSSHRNLGNFEFLKQKLEETPPEVLRPEPLLSGDDLIALGYQPGPKFKKILTAVDDAQLEGQLNDKPEALAYVARTFGPPN